MGLEPMISRTTIWRANQLHHTHHITYRTVFCPTKYHHIKFSGLNEPGGIRTLDLRLRRPLLYPAELQTHFNIPFSKGSPYFYGKAGDGNRTHVSSLEGWCSTIELHPHVVGVTGFEPATSWSQTRRSSQAEPHPGISYVPVSPVAQCLLYYKVFRLSIFFLHFFIFLMTFYFILFLHAISRLLLCRTFRQSKYF